MVNSLIQLLQAETSRPWTFLELGFWVFFALVLIGFASLERKLALRNAYLMLVSWFFYYHTSQWYVVLLIFATSVDFGVAHALHRSDKPWLRKLLLALSVLSNLGVLFFFKYAYFAADLWNDLTGLAWNPTPFWAGWSNASLGTDFVEDVILLPVGISFYTFQCLSYTIDVYRRNLKPVARFTDFAFYVSFFPQLVAGPIVRASDFVPQLYQSYRVTRAQFGLGLFWIINGFLKKVILADFLAVHLVDRIFSQPTLYTGWENALGLLAYTMQVYADFSGYTDIAIGIALWMGFTLAKNFDSPYKASSVGEFWKRWHMSLSSWLKDYLYIPLGGNRSGSVASYLLIFAGLFGLALSATSPFVSYLLAGVVLVFLLLYQFIPVFRRGFNTNVNLMLTMLLGGLWHGASWNFMVWGGLNGLGLLAHKQWTRLRPYRVEGWMLRGLGVLITLLFITFTRIWFRAPDWSTAMSIVNQLSTGWNAVPSLAMLAAWWRPALILAMGFAIHWIPERYKAWYRDRFANLNHFLLAGISLAAILLAYQFMAAESQPFIYFQF
ncbi:MAG: MBOAT family protein [Flavobacteriaceae bacterium]|nr:MBOAT family protein [Flavobacteriaceae bacterium]PHX83879.1 MAG: membrane-bound O-acyltransferase family protein [Flavobacteriales bacterium]